MSDKKTEAPKPADAAVPAAGGGMKAMLPLILNIVLMPVIAYVMTVFVLLPKINSAGVAAHAKTEGGDAAAESGGHGEPAKEEKGGGGKHGGGAGGKTSVPLSAKVLVNVSGTAGTRYLLAQLTLVGTHAELKDSVEKSDAQLRDVASSVLSAKTIADLDKPGSRNLIRTELISAFNGVLGEGRVKEIYFTDFAIQ
ncbi:MAG: flagellar basal body-associated FliL family protein [Verrucomicrobia bacterium]|jgi:flagellar FliL protein|nr:MAG: flagellar basal body-associated FliL family protein [Verrucomicrobiota bacterium]